jgi:hypothetical protein
MVHAWVISVVILDLVSGAIESGASATGLETLWLAEGRMESETISPTQDRLADRVHFLVASQAGTPRPDGSGC